MPARIRALCGRFETLGAGKAWSAARQWVRRLGEGLAPPAGPGGNPRRTGRSLSHRAVHEALEPRLVLATAVDLSVVGACGESGLLAREAPSIEGGTGRSQPASGTVFIDPTELGEPGMGTNLGKPGQPPLSTPVSNGVGDGPDAPPDPPPPAVEADLWVQLVDLPDPVAAGAELTYTVDLFNDGPSVAEDVVVTLAIPENTSFSASSVTTGTYAASAGRWIIGTLPRGVQRLSLTVLVDPAAADVGTVRALPLATSTTPDPNKLNNIAMANTAVIPPPDGNGPPAITSLAIAPPSIVEGETAQLTGTYAFHADVPGQGSEPLDMFVLNIDWDGDGAYEETLPVSGGAFAFGNVFPDDPPGTDSYNIRVELVDDAGGVATAEVPFTVVNDPPVVSAGSEASVGAGEDFLRTISFTDAGTDAPWIATIDWGDGTPPEDVMLFDRIFLVGHVFAAAGASTVSISVDDGDGGVGAASFVVTRPAPAAAAAMTPSVRDAAFASLNRENTAGSLLTPELSAPLI